MFFFLNFPQAAHKNESSEADSSQDEECVAVFAFQTSLCAVRVNFP